LSEKELKFLITKVVEDIRMRYLTKRFLNLIIICATLLPLWGAVESSATMIGLSTELLTKQSGLVVTGEVQETKSQWADNKEAIVTIATIAIQEVIKGRSAAKKIRVQYEGGEVDGMGMRVSDAAELTGGETVLLFLNHGHQNSDGAEYEIVGKAQGKYTIGNDNIARKKGFSVLDGKEVIDNDIPVSTLIEKIKKYENE
jgi:hypothetical protein